MIKTIKQFIRKMGIDIVRYNPEKMGVNPFFDMSKFLKNNKPIVFDIGANIGQTVFEMHKAFPGCFIHSFEPSPATYKILKDNISTLNNVKTYNYAIGSANGTLTLLENRKSDMSSFHQIGNDGWGEIIKETKVKVKTIDEICKEIEIDKIDILKTDTQGFELEVFKGAENTIRKNMIGLVYFEVTFAEIYKDLPPFSHIFSFLVERGFELVTIYPLYYKNNVASWTDCLFVHKNYNPF